MFMVFNVKDDRTNYVLGGLTSGVVFGAWARNLRAGVYGSAILATAAYVKKMSVEQVTRFKKINSANLDLCSFYPNFHENSRNIYQNLFNHLQKRFFVTFLLNVSS